MGADQRDKTARFEHGGPKRITGALDKMQLLIFDATDRYNHPATFGELRDQRNRRCRRGCSHKNRVEWCELWQTQRAVATMDVDVGVSQTRETLRGGGGQLSSIFDGYDLSGERREHGGLVAAPSADLEDSLRALEV